jgi:hypothetical protein
MTQEKWEEIKEMAKKNFEVLEDNIIELADEKGGGRKEELIFNGPLGKMKLEFVSKPLVLSKKTHYSKRMGDSAKVDYVTSETEKVHTLFAYKWDLASDQWIIMDSASFEN